MAVQGELPEKSNSRAGAGWWMDGDGAWRPPEEWPEDSPPFDGWTRSEDGLWEAPIEDDGDLAEPKRTITDATGDTRSKEPRLSRQARADRRAMLTVAGALVGAALLLIVALALITQAGATGTGAAQSATPEVIYAAQNDQAELAQRRALAANAPSLASEQLQELAVQNAATEVDFEPEAWTVESIDCLDISERVLIARSAIEVTFADQLECVPDRGSWTPRYLRTDINSVVGADVQSLVPLRAVNNSGGSTWTSETRTAYLTDTEHPATLHIVGRDGGHNPRGQTPDLWRPGNRAAWCAYAVDWVAVKARWDLSVTAEEADALEMMLATCSELDSDGADPNTIALDTITSPVIARSDDS